MTIFCLVCSWQWTLSIKTCKLKTNREEFESEKEVKWISRHQNTCSFLVRLLKFMSPYNSVLHKRRAIKAQNSVFHYFQLRNSFALWLGMSYTSWSYTPAFWCMVILSFPINREKKQTAKATQILPPKFPHKHVSSGQP